MPKWTYRGPDYHQIGTIEFTIMARDPIKKGARYELRLKAKTEDQDGDADLWWVWENETLVALGDQHGSRITACEQCERVLCYGPNDDDRRAVAAMHERDRILAEGTR